MLKKFLADPDLDPKSIDIHSDFMDYPAIFKTPQDVKDFILERNVEAPITLRFIQLCNENKLDWTRTETQFYTERFFDYIYDVYRIPIEQTFVDAADWIVKFNEELLLRGGVSRVIKLAYESIYSSFEQRIRFNDFYNEKEIEPLKRQVPIINCITDIPTTDYYICRRSRPIREEFWIKSARNSGQPEIIGEEAYMRVWVFPDKVYIFGCDDCSYTVESNNPKELDDFVLQLKCAAPVWNFDHDLLKEIHPKLEFTN